MVKVDEIIKDIKSIETTAIKAIEERDYLINEFAFQLLDVDPDLELSGIELSAKLRLRVSVALKVLNQANKIKKLVESNV